MILAKNEVGNVFEFNILQLQYAVPFDFQCSASVCNWLLFDGFGRTIIQLVDI